MNRFGRFVPIAAVIAPLVAGCAMQQPAIRYSTVQAQSAIITRAVQAAVQVYTNDPAPTDAERTASAQALAVVIKANQAIQAPTPAADWRALSHAFADHANDLLAILPLDPGTRIAIIAGLAVIDVFVAQSGAGAVPVPVPVIATMPGSS